MDAVYNGTGVIQLFGEFDKNLNTGFYWNGRFPNNKQFWGTFGQTVLPVSGGGPTTPAPTPKIKVKDVTGKGYSLSHRLSGA